MRGCARLPECGKRGWFLLRVPLGAGPQECHIGWDNGDIHPCCRSVLSFSYLLLPKKTVGCAQVDAARNLLYVRGQVPGHKGNFVRVRDAVLKTFGQQPQRPVPTFLEPLPLEPLLAPKAARNPFDYRE